MPQCDWTHQAACGSGILPLTELKHVAQEHFQEVHLFPSVSLAVSISVSC